MGLLGLKTFFLFIDYGHICSHGKYVISAVLANYRFLVIYRIF